MPDEQRPAVASLTRIGDHVECEDAVYAERIGGTAVLAVSDGMSTAVRAREGSALAVSIVRQRSSALASLPQAWNRMSIRAFLREQARDIRLRWMEECERLGDPVNFSSTLTIAVWQQPWLAIAALGDGFALALRGDDAHLVDVPFRDADGRTDSLAGRAPFRFTVVSDPEIDGVLLSSDGLSEIVRRHPIPGRPEQPSRQPDRQIAALLRAFGTDTERVSEALAVPQRMTRDDIGVAYALR
ncbi:protein phosphatase 2C domain-containing protein [Rathayibacter sp. AY1B8]|uniref:protein phosphatase 2C domain-containing protein n=1 Tax=Rathayibacter sp. AY1B8 TaxID=2080533 RepID=UPI000CE81DAA|nr:protein phosphatase 2C domain-containing protein [Rathayibacter sp. AY1B8]PPI05203.1 hypothetical protein C5C63_14640 [Rathayibacter sp. AY1B8]